MHKEELKIMFDDFLKDYDTVHKDRLWIELSDKFKKFWYGMIIEGDTGDLTDDKIDDIIRILDRNGKGNRKDAESVAKAMIPQGAWRRMFLELCGDKEISKLITKIFEENNVQSKINFIDELYQLNHGKKNNLTGKSGNAINAMLAAYNPMKNLSMISLKDRMMLIEFFEFPLNFNFEGASIGLKFIETNRIILEGFKEFGIDNSARTITSFCYRVLKPLWKDKFTCN
jgi:hypothetical protein